VKASGHGPGPCSRDGKKGQPNRGTRGIDHVRWRRITVGETEYALNARARSVTKHSPCEHVCEHRLEGASRCIFYCNFHSDMAEIGYYLRKNCEGYVEFYVKAKDIPENVERIARFEMKWKRAKRELLFGGRERENQESVLILESSNA